MNIRNFLQRRELGLVGRLFEDYTPTIISPASRALVEHGHWTCEQWINTRMVSVNIQIGYAHQGERHLLYSMTCTIPSKRININITTGNRHRRYGNYLQDIAAEYDRIVASFNNEPIESFLKREWQNAVFTNTSGSLGVSQEAQANLHRFFKPIVTERREVQSVNRPEAQQLMRRVGNNGQ